MKRSVIFAHHTCRRKCFDATKNTVASYNGNPRIQLNHDYITLPATRNPTKNCQKSISEPWVLSHISQFKLLEVKL